jgi:hypothetical protein
MAQLFWLLFFIAAVFMSQEVYVFGSAPQVCRLDVFPGVSRFAGTLLLLPFRSGDSSARSEENMLAPLRFHLTQSNS